jgi:hypothetical protein
MAVEFRVRFDGLDAKHHQIDMKQLGKAMIGLDRAISDSVFLATEGRLPRAQEQRSLVVLVEAPRAACVEILGVVETISGFLPIAIQILAENGTKFVFEYLSFLFKFRGGKRREADEHLMEAHRLLCEDRKDERRSVYENEAQWREHSVRLVETMANALKDVVSPVGRTAETLSLAAPDGRLPTVIDVPMAEALRSKQPLDVGEMTRMRLRVDGIIKHSRLLKVVIDGEPGRYVNAEVRDPVFDTVPNVYTDAVSSDVALEVDAKPTYRDGELVKLHIMNAA